MKVAITADAHLREERPERISALEEVFKETNSSGIEHLIIAGDLFDENPGLELVRQFKDLVGKFQALTVHVIPGNHDPALSPGSFALGNLKIYSQAGLADIEAKFPFLMIPYQESKSMGDVLSEVRAMTGERNWILIGHGDFMTGSWEPNLLEAAHGTKVYMPLVHGDLDHFKPRWIFLGHIHKQTPLADPLGGQVLYPGSPHGLDITETGRRRFLIFDDEADTVSEHWVDTRDIFFNETFFMVPSDDELARLEREITERFQGWLLTEEEIPKARVRTTINGFCLSTVGQIQDEAQKVWGRLLNSAGESVQTDKLSPESSDDEPRSKLAHDVFRQIELLAQRDEAAGSDDDDEFADSWWDFGGEEPSIEEVKQAALHIIYQK